MADEEMLLADFIKQHDEVDQQSIYSWLRRGYLKKARKVGRDWWVNVEEIETFIKTRVVRKTVFHVKGETDASTDTGDEDDGEQ